MNRIKGIDGHSTVVHKGQQSRWVNIEMGKNKWFEPTCEKRKLQSFGKYEENVISSWMVMESWWSFLFFFFNIYIYTATSDSNY